MPSKKIDILNPKKYLGKDKGDNQFARVAHVNHAIKIAEENGDKFQLDMGYQYYPEASQIVKSGTVIQYGQGGPAWEGHKLTGSVYPNFFGTGGINGNFTWYLCTVKTKMGEVWGPTGIIPYSLTGMVETTAENGVTPVFSPLGKGAMVYDRDTQAAVAVENMYITSNTWTGIEDGYVYQDLYLVVETDLTDYNFGCFYQFEFLLPEGSVAERFFD